MRALGKLDHTWLQKIGRKVSKNTKHIRKYIPQEVENNVGNLGSRIEREFGLDPTYKVNDEWSHGIEHFDGEGWMTERGMFHKNRHYKYTNKKTGEVFETQGHETYNGCKKELKLRIISHYGYDKSLDTIPIGETIAQVLFRIWNSKIIRAHGTAIILHGNVQLASLTQTNEVNLSIFDLPEFIESNPKVYCGGAFCCQGFQVISSRVSLPFSGALVGDLGFRHSSAIEFTKNVDCLIIVFSKSGSLSFAKSGRFMTIQRGCSPIFENQESFKEVIGSLHV